jgi:hypothetical protein
MMVDLDFNARDFWLDDGSGGMTPNPAIEQLIGGSDLIFGIDVSEARQYLVYGIAALKEMPSDAKAASELRVLRICVDPETDQLERLLVLVRQFKGSDDYQADEAPAAWQPR